MVFSWRLLNLLFFFLCVSVCVCVCVWPRHFKLDLFDRLELGELGLDQLMVEFSVGDLGILLHDASLDFPDFLLLGDLLDVVLLQILLFWRQQRWVVLSEFYSRDVRVENQRS